MTPAVTDPFLDIRLLSAYHHSPQRPVRCHNLTRARYASRIHKVAPLTSSQTTLKRIHREIADLKKEDLGPITLTPSEDSLFLWSATIPGPEGSCYEGGVFHADIRLSTDYP